MKVGLLQARRAEAVARVPWGAKRSLKESWIGSIGPIGRIHGGEGARPLSWEVAGGVRWRWPRVKGRQSGVGGRRDEGDNLASTQQKAAVAVPCRMTLYIIVLIVVARMTVHVAAISMMTSSMHSEISTTPGTKRVGSKFISYIGITITGVPVSLSPA